MTYTIGSLFSGYGGLDLAVERALGPARTAWVSDIEPGPCKILAARYPHAPNLGDITTVDWTQVEPVDVIAGGSPCQDLSMAGRRAGMKPGTRSGLWESMFHAITTIRPHLVVWENVRGAFSAPAFSLMESRERRVGDGADGPVLRALGRVLGDLASIGYDAQWVGLRASDVGAPHQRYRVFVAAHPAGDTWWLQHGDDSAAGDTDSAARDQWGQSAPGEAEGRGAWSNACGPDRAPVALLPTPRCDNNENRQSEGYGPNLGAALLPTPTTQPTTGNGHARNLGTEVRMLPTPTAERYGSNQSPSEGATVRYGLDSIDKLLPTPTTQDTDPPCVSQLDRNTVPLNTLVTLLPTPRCDNNENRQSDGYGPNLGNALAESHGFGAYSGAVRRWEQVTRPAPSPTELGPRGQAQLSPAFVEWMMGLPAGWVTGADIPSREATAKALQGVTPAVGRVQQLRALGNGVVPQQASAALSQMQHREECIEWHGAMA